MALRRNIKFDSYVSFFSLYKIHQNEHFIIVIVFSKGRFKVESEIKDFLDVKLGHFKTLKEREL